MKIDPNARALSYNADCKLVVVGEEQILPPAKSPKSAGSPVIGEFAKALYVVTGTRPVDPNWEKRGRDVQQYELRVKRMDIQFDEKLKQAYESAMGKGLWKGAPAAQDRVEYWAAGVQAYFDAAGESKVATRNQLKDYDSELFALVHETMAYQDRQDWRFSGKGAVKTASLAQ
jgi:hypothetical protein